MSKKDLDFFFNNNSQLAEKPQNKSYVSKHSQYIRWTKLLLPSLAAILVGILLILPTLKDDSKSFTLDITKPKSGELEKLHVENSMFYITDKDNKVNNFTATNIDETKPGSKLLKLNKPEGLLPLDELSWMSVKSPIGYYNQTTNNLTLTDNAEVFYNEGMSFYSFDMIFDFKTGKIYSDKDVSADGHFGKLKAEGFEFSTKKDILIFKGHSDITISQESFEEKK